MTYIQYHVKEKELHNCYKHVPKIYERRFIMSFLDKIKIIYYTVMCEFNNKYLSNIKKIQDKRPKKKSIS